ncbi:MAG: 16S rRNA processing protein RimM [Eubacteriaceae bacterium]|nr:16S rRNA processing protein RimM [Eubacteriaceae bacterium]
MKIGKIFSAHGIKGYVKIFPLTDDTERFYDLKHVFIKEKENMHLLSIEDILLKDKFVLIKFNQISNRNDAEKFKDFFIYVDRAQAVKLDKDEYFIEDLIGLFAYDENNINIGAVSDVIQTGSVDVLVIKGQKEFLIPALKKNVQPLIDQGMIKVNTAGGVESD